MTPRRYCPICGLEERWWSCQCWEAWNRTAWLLSGAMFVAIVILQGICLLVFKRPTP